MTAIHIRIMPAGTGIHCRTQNKICRKIIGSIYSWDSDHFILQRLSQNLQTPPWKLRHLIKKKHASVCQRDLSRSGISSAAGQCLRRTGMMWTSKWPFSHKRITRRQKPRDTVDFGQFQSFLKTQWRHDPGYSFCYHGFSCSRWSDHKQIVKSTDCNLYRSSKTFLPFDLTEICFFRIFFHCTFDILHTVVFRISQILDHFIEISHTDYFHIRNQSCLFQIFCRDNAKTTLFFPCPYYHWQNSWDCMNVSIQADFSGHHDCRKLFRS